MMPIKYVKSYNFISIFYHNRHVLLALLQEEPEKQRWWHNISRLKVQTTCVACVFQVNPAKARAEC